uniref:Uncharacterized protein n=1 Tax=Meloidogyne hapla TaxID=6305 RepID=A0A1I8BZK4_MELHA
MFRGGKDEAETSNSRIKKKALFITTNLINENFKMNSAFANLLTENYTVESKFEMAFFETTNVGALFFFHLAGIENVFGINNNRLLAYQFKYAGKDFPKNVPGEIQNK